MNCKLLGASLAGLAAASPALGQNEPSASGSTVPVPPARVGQQRPGTIQQQIVITGQRLDKARDSITSALGASQYTFPRETLEREPGGTDVTLNKVLLQAPGVQQDSYGQLHVRNEHANLQYRLNGVIVPESITGFGTTFDPRIANSIDLITGTLPAQYGYRTAGVVNFETQSGLLGNGGEIGSYGGSFGWIEPSLMVQGSTGNFSYFVSGSYLRNDIGIEDPLPRRQAIHDRTAQIHSFAYVSDILSDKSRISLFGGSFIGHFEIPDVAGIGGSFAVNGLSSYDAAELDQRQREITHYGVAAYQYAGDRLNFQIAPFVRYTQTLFTPDPNLGDVIFNGFADRARLSGLATGVQADASTKIGSRHTLRFGAFVQNEHTTSDVISNVLPVDQAGNQTSDIPFAIVERASKSGQLYGVYLQDEWALSDRLTLNYGGRFDIVRAFTRENQLSPRANLVWKPTGGTTVHIGYARTFTPPPQELIAPEQLALYTGTTKQPLVNQADPVKAEREHYVDGGVEQRFGQGFKIAIDAYYKKKRNLLDEGQFGEAVILAPFNYAKGYAWGIELTGSYTRGPLDLYANVARGQERGKDIVSSQYFFGPDELAYIHDHSIYTDHTQKLTASGGASYAIKNGIGTLIPSMDFLYGSGLRTGDPAGIVPNGGELPSYFVLNAGLSERIDRQGALHGVMLRVDLLNLFDHQYQIRSGSGVGVGAPQWGQRRGLFVGLSKRF